MNSTVLFVDDEMNVIQGLRRSLRHMCEEWRMIFANSGAEALELIDGGGIDVVVSDMRMPVMDGATLLIEVEKRDPRAIRFILSGQTSYEDANRLVGVCQQFLAKPCETELLITRVRQALSLRHILGDPNLQAFVGSLRDLPSPPEASRKIAYELCRPDTSIVRVAEVVSGDVGLSTKLLQIARWGCLGTRHKITTIGQAVNLLGIERVNSIALSHGISSQYEDRDLGVLSLSAFSDHGAACANLAQSIAKAEKMDSGVAEKAFVSGLLHDIGSLVLVINDPDAYATLVSEEKHGCHCRLERELELIGGKHTVVGAYLAGLWGLPYDVVETVAYHHSPSDCPSGCFDVLTVVHAAEALLQGLHSECRDQTLSKSLDLEYLKQAGVLDRLPVWTDLMVEQNRRAKEL